MKHQISTIVVLLFCACGIAQEASYVDLATMPHYDFLNRNGEGAQIAGASCGIGDHRKHLLSVVLVSLDHQSVQFGNEIGFTVRIRNIGEQMVRIPFDPNPADTEPSDAQQAYEYETADFGVMVKEDSDGKDPIAISPRRLYGSSGAPWTYRELAPNQSMTVHNSGRVDSSPGFRANLKATGRVEIDVAPSIVISRTTYNPHDSEHQGKSTSFSRCELATEFGDYQAKAVLLWPLNAASAN